MGSSEAPVSGECPTESGFTYVTHQIGLIGDERPTWRRNELMTSTSTRDALRNDIFSILTEVTGDAQVRDHIGTETEFPDTGMSSIEYLALIEKIETRFGVLIDLEASHSLTSVDRFVDLLQLQGESA
jgi:acyl carrier protein